MSNNISLDNLVRYSLHYCNVLPIGSCANKQYGSSFYCYHHTCKAVLEDGSTCPNPCDPSAQICVEGYHRENGRLQQYQQSLQQQQQTACYSYGSSNPNSYQQAQWGGR